MLSNTASIETNTRYVEIDMNRCFQMNDLLSGDQRNLQSYDIAREVLGETVPIAVSLECGEVYSPAGLE